MAKHREGVQGLADKLIEIGFTQLPYDDRDDETLPPFSFMVAECYRLDSGPHAVLRDLVLRTDGEVIDVKGYYYKDAASHTSILRVPTYIMVYSMRRPSGRYLNLITGIANSLLSEIITDQVRHEGFNAHNPSGIWLLDQSLDQLEAYRAGREVA